MASRSWKQLAAAGAAVLVLGGGALGVAWAQQAPATPPAQSAQATPSASDRGQDHRQAFLSALAAKLGITTDKLQQAISEVRQEQGLPSGKGFGGRHRGGPGMGHGMGLDAAAQAIGITPDQLRQELPNKSLTDVARAHNVDPGKVANALKKAANDRIDQAVTAGRLNADQANQKKSQEAAEIDQLMTRTFGQGGPNGFHKRPGGSRSPAPAATPGA
jgi:hypothetical protein